MLKPNVIPDHEPLIRVGIVLPEDHQKEVRISSHSSLTIYIDDSKAFHRIKKQLTLRIKDHNLSFLSGKSSHRCKSLKIEASDPESEIGIEPIRAGRAFHWEKDLSITLTHRLEMSVKDGNLLVINELPFERYISCVTTSEMNAECPDAYIEAQAITARSWMLANVEQKHVDLGFDVCNDDCCQRYQGTTFLTKKAMQVAEKTRGIVITHDQIICDARYSKSCGGVTEKFENLWEGNGLAYMQNQIDSKQSATPDLTDEKEFCDWIDSVPECFCSPHFIPENRLHRYLGKVDQEKHYFRWTVFIQQQNLLENINQKTDLEAKAILDLIPVKRGGSGRMLEMILVYLDQHNRKKEISIFKDYEVRRVLHPEFLFSSACYIRKVETGRNAPDFEYHGGGWGHGAGLCQIGALGMSLNGYSCESILKHYYPGVSIDKIYK